MAEISFHAGERRLVVTGPCRRSDSDAIVDAIEVFAGLVDPLVLDLTGAAVLPREVSVSVIAACRNAERVGHQVNIQTLEEDHVVRLLHPQRTLSLRAGAAGRN
jgi:hypothetical protein